jgi:hypothetical protein
MRTYFDMTKVYFLLFLLFLSVSYGCYLWGTDSGECTRDSLVPLWRESVMPYCQYSIEFPICVPKTQVTRPTYHNFYLYSSLVV